MSAENKINTSLRVSQCRVISCEELAIKKLCLVMQPSIHYTLWLANDRTAQIRDKPRWTLFSSRNHKPPSQPFAFPAVNPSLVAQCWEKNISKNASDAYKTNCSISQFQFTCWRSFHIHFLLCLCQNPQSSLAHQLWPNQGGTPDL